TSLLQAAIFKNNIDALVLLLQAGADPSIVSSHGWTPLHTAVQYGNYDAVELLLRRNNLALVNAKNSANKTPLDIAIQNNFLNLAELLIDKGAILDSEDKHEVKPINKAIISNNVPMVRLFLEKGAKK